MKIQTSIKLKFSIQNRRQILSTHAAVWITNVISKSLYFTKITLDKKQDRNLHSPSLLLMSC